MLRRLIDWWRSRRLRRTRLLFRYWDGTKWKSVDPLRVYRSIKADPKYDAATMYDAVNADEEPETTYCVEAICRAFGAERYDPERGVGLTDGELLNVYMVFQEYCETLKKNSNPSPTSPPVSASPEPRPPLASDSPPNTDSVSGCC